MLLDREEAGRSTDWSRVRRLGNHIGHPGRWPRAISLGEVSGSTSGYQTPSARLLGELARQVAGGCPDRLGQEIALIGSAASGWADEQSDFELVLFVADLPDREATTAWTDRIGVTSVTFGEEGGGPHLICLYQDVWLELQWRTFEQTNRLIDSVLNAETTSRRDLVAARTIEAAVPLRTSGKIASWQSRLSAYPENQAQRIVAESTEFWRAPHHIETLWGLADRDQMFSLVEWLQADIQDALRVLFAINRRWEPDWKWLNHHLNELTMVPDRLCERIDSVFAGSDPHQAVDGALCIVEDVLALAESEFAVSLQLSNVRRARNDQSAPSGSSSD